MTLHQQLLAEKRLYPRRHKLAVKIQRSEPSSKLKAGKYYVHAYQVKIYNPELGSRWLGTSRLVQKLKRKFGSAYHPRPNRVLTSNQDNPHHHSLQQTTLNQQSIPLQREYQKNQYQPVDQNQVNAQLIQNAIQMNQPRSVYNSQKNQFQNFKNPSFNGPLYQQQGFFPVGAHQGMG